MASKTLAKNRKARFEYEIQKTMEVGIVLLGTATATIMSRFVQDAYYFTAQKFAAFMGR